MVKKMLSQRNVGLKEEESEKQSNTFYSSAYTCPLTVFIDLVCDDNIQALVISGTPTNEELEEARISIINKYYEISNNEESSSIYNETRNYYKLRNQITGFEVCLKLVCLERYENCISFLCDNGLKCKAPEDEKQKEKLIKKIDMLLKSKLIKLKESSNKINKKGTKTEKPTREYFNKLIVTISASESIKMPLDKNKLTVAEFAGYINLFTTYQNQLKSLYHGRKH